MTFVTFSNQTITKKSGKSAWSCWNLVPSILSFATAEFSLTSSQRSIRQNPNLNFHHLTTKLIGRRRLLSTFFPLCRQQATLKLSTPFTSWRANGTFWKLSPCRQTW